MAERVFPPSVPKSVAAVSPTSPGQADRRFVGARHAAPAPFVAAGLSRHADPVAGIPTSRDESSPSPATPVRSRRSDALQPVSANLSRSSRELPLQPWRLPAQGLAVFHGAGDVARLSHYFLPHLLMEGKRVLMLDGANAANPRLIERLARERGVPFAQFSRQIQIARAFTCFQLTELIARVPQFRCDFPAEVLIVTAFPDLYFDEDVRDWNARVAFEQALANLQRWATNVAPVYDRRPDPALRERRYKVHPGATVAVFSAVEDFPPSSARRRFFSKLCAVANEVWRFSVGAENRLKLIAEPPRARLGGL